MCEYCNKIRQSISAVLSTLLEENPGLALADAIQATFHITAQNPALNGYCTCFEPSEDDAAWFTMLHLLGVDLAATAAPWEAGNSWD